MQTFKRLLCTEEVRCILELVKASTDAVGKASPNNASWALNWKGITKGLIRKIVIITYSVNFLSNKPVWAAPPKQCFAAA
jgi:hypothetical protein